MASTLLKDSQDIDRLKFETNTAYIHCKDFEYHVMYDGNIDKHNKKNFIDKNKNVKYFVSDQKKLMISILSGPYHLLMNSFSILFHKILEDPQCFLIIDISNIKETDHTFMSFLYTVLKDNKIDYVVVDRKSLDYIVINNFYYVADPNDGIIWHEDLFDIAKKYVKNTSVVPHRKVYLSRKRIPDRTYIEAFKNLKVDLKKLSYNNDNRIYNEEELEQFFKSNGFEIICPEDFINLQQQIDFFYSTKTLVSVTSSGLTNCIFMQDNQTVIELETPLTIQYPDVLGNPIGVRNELHHFYKSLSYLKSHNYIAIANKTRMPSDLIQVFNNNQIIKEVLK